MSISLFMIIFFICTVLTPLLTQAIKMIFINFKAAYVSNIIVLVTSLFVSVFVVVFVYLSQSIPFTLLNVFYIIFMFIANWLGSMIGYDKVRQAFTQIAENKTTSI